LPVSEAIERHECRNGARPRFFLVEGIGVVVSETMTRAEREMLLGRNKIDGPFLIRAAQQCSCRRRSHQSFPLQPSHRQMFLAIYAIHPLWTRSASSALLVEILEHFEQCLLRHFLRVFTLPAHQPAIVENLGAEMSYKAVKGLRFAGDQLPWLRPERRMEP
jgi:hypothetical protein